MAQGIGRSPAVGTACAAGFSSADCEAMVMDDKDRAAAYKALIAWFDSQDIGTEDAANIMLVLLADMIWQSTNHTAAEAAVLADNLHLQITRQLGLHLAQDLEKFFGKDKDQ